MPDIDQATLPDPVTVTVDIGIPVEIVFDSNRISPRWMRESALRDEERDPLSVPQALADVILSWNMTKADQPYEPTAENISVLSYPKQSVMLQEIIKAALPSSEEGNGSRNTSSTPTESSSSMPASLPNGDQLSSLAPSSASPSPK